MKMNSTKDIKEGLSWELEKEEFYNKHWSARGGKGRIVVCASNALAKSCSECREGYCGGTCKKCFSGVKCIPHYSSCYQAPIKTTTPFNQIKTTRWIITTTSKPYENHWNQNTIFQDSTVGGVSPLIWIVPIVVVGISILCLFVWKLYGKDETSSRRNANESMGNSRNQNLHSDTNININSPASMEMESVSNNQRHMPSVSANLPPPSYSEVLKTDSEPPDYLESYRARVEAYNSVKDDSQN